MDRWGPKLGARWAFLLQQWAIVIAVMHASSPIGSAAAQAPGRTITIVVFQRRHLPAPISCHAR